jgi:DNA-binding response OmpR family regulator
LERTSKRILVVDDDVDTRALMVDILEEDGYYVHACPSAEEAVSVLRREKFDLILSDIKMPRMSGIDLLLHVRRMNLDTEVILITAFASVKTAVQALRGEAFDYLMKPFSLSEFRQRVGDALRLQDAGHPWRDVMHYEDLSIDYTARRVWVGEREVRLTRLEFNVLAYLFEHRGCAISQEDLLQNVWEIQNPNERSPASVKSCISRLRKKLHDDAQAPCYIRNVWGVGYQLGE